MRDIFYSQTFLSDVFSEIYFILRYFLSYAFCVRLSRKMKAVNKRVSAGTTIELGEEIEASSIDVNRGNRILKAVTSGREADYVYLEGRFQHGDSVDIPEDSEIVEVVSGSNMANPVVRYLTPVSVYRGDSE